MVSAFRDLRPDLVCLEMDTRPTGTVVLMTPDPTASALTDHYDALVAEYVTPDPQTVPDDILRRTRAVSPDALVEAPIWDKIRSLRGQDDAQVRSEIRGLLSGAGVLKSA